jgi:two-component system, NtrC family, sensor kinase
MTELHGANLESVASELLDLEELNLRGELSAEQRARWMELNEVLFGVPQDLVEKRKFFRINTDQHAVVLSPNVDPGATILSLSGGGVFVRSASVPPVGSSVELEVVVPSAEQTRVTLRGRVCWRTTGGGPQSAVRGGFGLSFQDLGELERTAVFTVIRDHVMRHVSFGLEKYRFFLETSPDFAVLVDRRNNVVAGNQIAHQLLCRDASETLTGSPIMESIDAASAQSLLGALDFTRSCGTQSGCELEFSDVAGSWARRLDVRTSEIRSADVHLGVLIVGRDISDRHRMDEQRRDLERRLYHADKLATLGQVTAGVAHDVNNPLAWVCSNLEVLNQLKPAIRQLAATELQRAAPRVPEGVLQEIVESLDELVSDSLAGTARIRDIMHDLKTFTRMDAQHEEDVDLRRALDVTVRIIRNQIAQRAHVVRDYCEVPTTFVNFGKVSQILLNLVTNAVRCFRTSEVDRNTITLSTRVDGKLIRVCVEDNGPGIPAELRDKIFEPFFTHGCKEGTGLGLPIALDAARAIQAELTIDTEVGRGTRFTVSIPVRTGPSKPPSSRHTVAGGRRASILVVDDEAVLLRSLERLLRKQFDVTTAANAQDALTCMRTTPLDVILCDVMMPGNTGLWLYEQAAGITPGLETRFIFMTGGIFGEQERRELDALPNIVIEKPLDLGIVQDLLIDFVGLRG